MTSSLGAAGQEDDRQDRKNAGGDAGDEATEQADENETDHVVSPSRSSHPVFVAVARIGCPGKQ